MRGRGGVTIKHVAADAGVSLQTVSRVINDEPNVRPQMAARVREAIERLGYVPSIAAQRMGGSRSRLIVALNDRDRTIADWRGRQGVDWVDQMLLGGMLTCAEHGYRLLLELVDTHSDHVEREVSAALGALRPDGVILTPPHSHNPAITELLAERGVPFARIGSLAPGPGLSLTMGDEDAAALATRHLIDQGHRRIGFVAGPADYEVSGRRVVGFQAAMAGAALAADLLIEGDFTAASGRAAAEALLSRPSPPTGLIASNDQMTLGALDAVRARGMSVPGDVSLLSFDDTPVVRFVQPPLDAVVQQVAQVTARAVELLIAGLNGEPPPAGPMVLPAGLVLRGSTAPPRA